MSSTPSAPPPGVPQSSNAKYAIVAILLVLGAGGLYAWRAMNPQPPPTPVVMAPSATASATAATTNSKIDDIPPPPPIYDKPEAGAPKVIFTGGGGSTCEKTCSGSPTPELFGAIQVRGMQTRRCYNQALNANPSLKGRVAINLRISPAGTVCSASVASNDMGTPAVAECAATIFRNASYPAPKGGCVEVPVPLNFTTPGQ